jgi:hypothetical protein
MLAAGSDTTPRISRPPWGDHKVDIQRWTALIVDVCFASAILMDNVATGSRTPINRRWCAIADKVIRIDDVALAVEMGKGDTVNLECRARWRLNVATDTEGGFTPECGVGACVFIAPELREQRKA